MTYNEGKCDLCGGPIQMKEDGVETQGLVTSHNRYWCGCTDTKGIDFNSWAFEENYLQKTELINPRTGEKKEYVIVITPENDYER